MTATKSLSNDVGVVAACDAFLISRSAFYRQMENQNKPKNNIRKNTSSPLALSNEERKKVLDILHSDRFIDKSPHHIYAALLDEGTFLCSIRTMYRLLKNQHGAVLDRRKQVRRTSYSKPELLATGPNQVWSWDITKLKSKVKWNYFYLYVIIDIFSRYVVGWMVAHHERTSLAKQLIEESCQKQNIEQDQLILHSDRGPSMKSKGAFELLSDLGVSKSHSRPYVSNDNPFSEAQFKTLKYSPQFPENFGIIEDSRVFCRDFFFYYNKKHYHTGIGLIAPEKLHYGMADQIYDERRKVLERAFNANPDRFKGKIPLPPEIPDEVWINKPKSEEKKR